MSNLFSIILKTFILGPIIGTSYSSNKSNSILTSSGIIIAIIDAVLYGIGFYLSIVTMTELHDQLIVKEQKQSLLSSNQAMEVLIRTQVDLYDLIKDLLQNNTLDRSLSQNSLDKLRTLEFVHNDSVMTIKRNINESLHYFDQPTLPNRINFYVYSSSLLLYIQQIILWFLQYLTLKNPKQYLTCSFILSAIILSQSLGFTYFLQITSTSPFPSPLYIYTFIFLIRSFMSIYHHTFCDYLF